MIDVQNKTIVIDNIKLGMSRVMRQGYDEEYLVIPVWDFYGYETFTLSEEELLIAQDYISDYTFTEDGNVESTTYKTYLTINALDGSIIDRAKGY